eukprot:1561421-Pleurochrysis_carterae.AAC.4
MRNAHLHCYVTVQTPPWYIQQLAGATAWVQDVNTDTVRAHRDRSYGLHIIPACLPAPRVLVLIGVRMHKTMAGAARKRDTATVKLTSTSRAKMAATATETRMAATRMARTRSDKDGTNAQYLQASSRGSSDAQCWIWVCWIAHSVEVAKTGEAHCCKRGH